MIPGVFIVTSGREVAAARGLARPGDRFLCATSESLEAAKNAGYPADLLDQIPLAEHFDAINQWALRSFIRLSSRYKSDPAIRAFIECGHYWMRMDLIRSVKFWLTWDRTLGGFDPVRIHIADTADLLFRRTVEAWCDSRHPGVRTVVFRADPASAAPVRPLTERLRKIAQVTAGTVVNGWDRVLAMGSARMIMVSGSLRHLGSLIEELRSRGERMVYADVAFHWRTWIWCVSRGIRYSVLGTTLSPKCPLPEDGPLFESNGRNIGGSELPEGIDRALIEVWSKTWTAPRLDFDRVRSWIAVRKVRAAILDEDIATRRPVWVACAMRGIPSFVLSHGVPSYKLRGPGVDPGENLTSSLTYVNSEFEKTIYISCYYDPERLVVSGLPRYDPLHGLRRQERSSSGTTGKLRTILYCGSSVIPHDFSRQVAVDDFMASGNYSLEWNQTYLTALVKALPSVPGARLVVKPHFADESVYREWINGFGNSAVTLAAHDANIFDLESECDVLVTAESTVQFEAVFLRKPVILMHYHQVPLQIMTGKEKWLRVARNDGDLAEQLRGSLSGESPEITEEEIKEIWAFDDGRSAKRVADHLLSEAERPVSYVF